MMAIEHGYIKAEKLIKEIVCELNCIIDRDKQHNTLPGIYRFFHNSLDGPIQKLINAKAFMASDDRGIIAE